MNVKTVKLIRDIASTCLQALPANQLRDIRRYICTEVQLANAGKYGNVSASAIMDAFASLNRTHCRAAFEMRLESIINRMNCEADKHRSRLCLPKRFCAYNETEREETRL